MKRLTVFSTIFLIYFGFTISSPLDIYSQLKLKEPPFYYKVRGDHYRRIGLLDKALTQYDKATFIKEDYPECYYWSAVIYKEKQLYTQALYEIQSAIKHKDKFFTLAKIYDTFFLEVEIYLAINDEYSIKEAKKRIEMIIVNLKSKKAKLEYKYQIYLIYQLGKSFFYKGRYFDQSDTNSRIIWFDQAIHFNYKPAQAHYHKYLLYKNKNLQEAKKSLEKALKLNPNVILEFRRNVSFRER